MRFLAPEITSRSNTAIPLQSQLSVLAEKILVIIETQGQQAAMNYLHDFLMERAVKAQSISDNLLAGYQNLVEEKGRISIEALAAKCLYSPRQLERNFNKTMGVSPKTLAGIIRFENARDRL